MYVQNLFNCLSVDGHLGCFHLWVIVNNDAPGEGHSNLLQYSLGEPGGLQSMGSQGIRHN